MKMRFAMAVLLIAAVPLGAAPVPKELRKPALAGMWEITGSNVWANETSDYNGQHWRFAPDGGFTSADPKPGGGHQPPRTHGSYQIVPEGVDVKFGGAGVAAALGRFDFHEGRLRLAFANRNDVRPADLNPASGSVIYTFKRVGE